MDKERGYAMKTRVEKWGDDVEATIHAFETPRSLREQVPYERVLQEESGYPLDSSKPTFIPFDGAKYEELHNALHAHTPKRTLRDRVTNAFKGHGRQPS